MVVKHCHIQRYPYRGVVAESTKRWEPDSTYGTMIMLTLSQISLNENQHIIPLASFIGAPLMTPLTDEKGFA
jgi:hypothetical protein